MQVHVGLTIPEIARACLDRNGVAVYGASSVSLVERALHTTSDFPLVLADVINKTLRASYSPNRTHAPSSLQNIRLSADAANPVG
jgi:hypothetical protein